MNFFVFDSLSIKLVSIDLKLNSTRNHTYFYQTCGSDTQKSNETQNLKNRVKIKNKTFVIERL